MEADQVQGTDASSAADAVANTNSGAEAQASKVAGLASMGLFDGVAENDGVPAPRPAAAAPVVEEVDPLDDSLFDDEHLSTPEGVREARDRIIAEKRKANELRKKAHNAHSAAEAREAKFRKTKEQTLAERNALQGQYGILRNEIAAIRSGDPEAFLAAVGRLSGSSDPSTFWREAAIKLAGGGAMAEQPGRPDPALQKEIQEIKAVLQQQAEAAQRQVAAGVESQIQRLRAEQVEYARTSTAHPFVAHIAQSNPAGIDEALMRIKEEEHRRTGRPIDSSAACSLLETELKAQYEMFQRANGSSQSSTGERGTAGPVPDRGRETTATAKPGTPQSQAQAPRHAISIPASLSAEPAARKRPTTREEERRAKIAALSSIGFFND